MEKQKTETVKKKKKIPLGWKIVLSVLLVLILLTATAFAIFWHKLDLIQFGDEISEEPAASSVVISGDESVDVSGLEPVSEPPEIPEMEIFKDSDVVNILILGTDERTVEFSSARSDCMILLSIHKGEKTVKLISLEREMGVPILEGKYKGNYEKLTHIFRYGGADLVVKTVEHCFKVDVPYYVRFNFHSVEEIINIVGGVDIQLTAKEADGLNGKRKTNAVTRHTVHEGWNHLDGYDALQYARQRYIDSDWQRVKRQRNVILAVVEAVKDSGLKEFNELANTVLPMIQTNMSKLEVADLIFYAPTFLRSEFDQMTIPKQGTYGSMKIMSGKNAYAPNYEINNELIRRFLYEGASSKELLAK